MSVGSSQESDISSGLLYIYITKIQLEITPPNKNRRAYIPTKIRYASIFFWGVSNPIRQKKNMPYIHHGFWGGV